MVGLKARVTSLAIQTPSQVVGAMPSWPKDGDRVAWLVCTAEWALALRPCDEKRYYAHFALTELVELGREMQARHVMEALTSRPCKHELLNRAADEVAVAGSYVVIGDTPAALKRLRSLAAATAREQRKSTREFGYGEILEFLVAHGAVDSGLAKTHKTAHARERLVGERLASTTSLLPPETVKTSDNEEAAIEAEELRREAEASLARLHGEWNVHFVANDVREAVLALQADGQLVKAHALFDTALGRLEQHDFDGRGFATGGAYLDIAGCAQALGRISLAKDILEQAMKKAAGDRRMLIMSVSIAFAELGDLDRAIAFAESAPKSDRVRTLAEVYCRGRCWSDLASTLAKVTKPEEGATIAWSVASFLK